MNPKEATLAKEMEETLRTFRKKTRKLFECKPKEKRFTTVPGTISLNQVDQNKMIVKALLGNKPDFVRVMMNNSKYRRELPGWQLLQLAALNKSGAEAANILIESLIAKDNFTVGSLDENGWPLISYLYIWDTNRPLKEEEKTFASFCLDVALFHGNVTTALSLAAAVGNPSISNVLCAMIGKNPKEMFHVMEPFFSRLAGPLMTPIVSESSLSLNIAHWALVLRQPIWFDRLVFMHKELQNCLIPENGMTYLHLACLIGDEKSVDLILSLGKVENPIDKMGFHPLCYNHDYRGSFLKAFLERYPEEVIRARFGPKHEFSLLHLAVILGDRQFAYELVFIMKMEIGWKNVNSLSANDLCFILDKLKMFEIINGNENDLVLRAVEMQPHRLGNISDFNGLLTPATH